VNSPIASSGVWQISRVAAVRSRKLTRFRKLDWIFRLAPRCPLCLLFIPLSITLLHAPAASQATTPAPSQTLPPTIELSRQVRPWEFLPSVGQRAALLGNEAGQFEAWVYPIKIFRSFHLIFHIAGRSIPAENLARTLSVRPESTTLLYADDSFQVKETLLVPVREPGAVIKFEIETSQRLEIEATFIGDFSLEWPAAIGGTYLDWDANQKAVVFGEGTQKFAALVGSPTAEDPHVSYETNNSSSQETSFRLGQTQKGHDTKLLVICASVNGFSDAQKTYRNLASSYDQLEQDSENYYHDYLARTVNFELPDHDLQTAYDWARMSVIQGLVENPYLGTGLIAGYRTSGFGTRPGFAWFFGRDALWTSFALDSAGDYSTTRTALDFLSKYQRADGKIPHEIAQTATLTPWFKDYPYPYDAADATPLFIIAIDDYVSQSGDVDFARDKWDNLWRAYQFLRSTYDAQGLAQNAAIGSGWVEEGPLLPVKAEYYQSGLGVEALHALSDLAGLLGKNEVQTQLASDFEAKKTALDQAFWSPELKSYAFALDANGQQVDEPSPLATVPMWFGLAEPDHANDTITQLANPGIQTDWGMRILSSQSKRYDPAGYHFGTVWPLFTGWASVGEYKYHRALPAYSNLRTNALLGFGGSLGHFTEVLSGNYYQELSTSSLHQVWSAAMVVSPLLRGLFGLETNFQRHEITLAPHVPPQWTSFSIRNIQVAKSKTDVEYRKTLDRISFTFTSSGASDCWVNLSPAFSLRTKIISAEMNGKSLPFKIEANSQDQHATMRFHLSGGVSTVTVKVKNDFGLQFDNDLPPLGSTSRGLRMISSDWTSDHTQLTLTVSGLPGQSYEIGVWNPAQITLLEGAALTAQNKIRIVIPNQDNVNYVNHKLVIHLVER
jgi:glycogen debranching enzyme